MRAQKNDNLHNDEKDNGDQRFAVVPLTIGSVLKGPAKA
jgi:hypothetical protein